MLALFVGVIPGALLATPLTVTVMIVLREFASTRWLPELLANEQRGEQEERPVLARIKHVLSPSS